MKQIFLLIATLHILSLPACSASKNYLDKLTEQEEPAIRQAILAQPEEFTRLAQAMLKEEPALLRLVDKQHLLAASDDPKDLVSVDQYSWATVNRPGHQLRQVVIDSIKQMSSDARQEGVTLMISSCYRSYNYQVQVFSRWIKQLGEKEARRISAPAGASQHQLGTVIDFGSIDKSFTNTKAERWLRANAYRYGWSLSFPDGYEQQTGYSYESWHYRYLGREALEMQITFFDNLQYKMLEFWHRHEIELRTILKL